MTCLHKEHREKQLAGSHQDECETILQLIAIFDNHGRTMASGKDDISRRKFLTASGILVLASCVATDEKLIAPANPEPIETKTPMKKIISTKNAPGAIGPYSQAVLVNGFLYTSGQIALNPANGELVMDNIQNETHQVMKNLKALLTEAGMDFSHVIKTGIFLQSMNDFAAVNEVYASYFTADFPARETVEVAKLPKGANVEISFVAFKG